LQINTSGSGSISGFKVQPVTKNKLQKIVSKNKLLALVKQRCESRYKQVRPRVKIKTQLP